MDIDKMDIDKQIKNIQEKIGEMIKIMVEIVKCSKINCSAQENKMNTNKKTAALVKKYNTEPNNENKIKLINEISKNNLIYEYSKCVVKNCKKIFDDYIKFLKSFINILPDNNPKREKFEKFITELEKIFNSSKLSKSQFKISAKNIAELKSLITSI